MLPKIEVTAEAVDAYRADDAVSTTKTDTPLRDIPQSVSVITRQEIDDLNMQNIGDAMAYVPGVTMGQGEGNRETPIIRGTSSTGDFFLDGMRDDVQYYRDLYNIERVEVLRGPNGSVFGRGGVAGLINRVTKEAGWEPSNQLTAQFGSNSNLRGELDAGIALADEFALRLNAVYEDSGSYRDDVTLKRYGVNPTVSWRAEDATRATFGVEYFRDERVADRGVSSYQGRPLDVDPSTFFGDPLRSPADTTVKQANLLVEHRFSDTFVLQNRTRYADYDKFYQNVFPGATSSAGTIVSISAYNNATQRTNFFNQTDLKLAATMGSFAHKLLMGVELGRQETDNFRTTGYFDSIAPGTTTVNVPVSNPRTTLPLTFRQSATDADNSGTARIAAAYVQDEVSITPRFIATAGLRYDSFRVDMDNNRNGQSFRSDDDLLSPRLGLVFKAADDLSIYANYSLAYQPRSGDQLASLSLSNESLDPEEFTNYEIGAKWLGFGELELTAALFRIERGNVVIPNPANPALSILVDGQRNQGLELGLGGRITERWSVLGQYTWQDGQITTTQSAAVRKGATLANLPANTVSLWNRFELSRTWGVGLGVIHKDEMLAAVESLEAPANNVKVPDYTRIDAAVYYTPDARWRAQLNVENLLDVDYFEFAHSNTNITPGSPLAIRAVVSLNF